MKMENRSTNIFRPTIVGDLVDHENLLAICKERNVHRIIVALDERRGKLPLEQLLACRMEGIIVDDGMAFTEELAGKLSVESVTPSSLIFSNGFKRSLVYDRAKRCLDIIGATIGLLLCFPLVS
jgi:hypothetical protein